MNSQKLVAATTFKAQCLRIIEIMARDRQPVVITRRGRPVATLSPMTPADTPPIIGVLKGTVFRYDDPFTPATDADDWKAIA